MEIEIKEKFDARYFSPRSDKSYRMSKAELFMARSIHIEMRKVLALFPEAEFYKDVGIIKEEDYRSYKKEGRVIPVKSEHFFGYPNKLSKVKDIKIYGEYWTQSVGALSFSTDEETNLFEVFETIAKDAVKTKIRFGTVSYLEGGVLKKPVIDVSNRKDSIYNRWFSRIVRVTPRFTVSKNGGVTVRTHIVKNI